MPHWRQRIGLAIAGQVPAQPITPAMRPSPLDQMQFKMGTELQRLLRAEEPGDGGPDWTVAIEIKRELPIPSSHLVWGLPTALNGLGDTIPNRRTGQG